MKKLIIALVLAVSMIMPSFTAMANDITADEAQIIQLPVQHAKSKIDVLKQENSFKLAAADEAAQVPSTGGSSSGGGGGSTGSTGSATDEVIEEIIVSYVSSDNFYVSEPDFTVSVEFAGEEFMIDARDKLKLRLYAVGEDGDTMVASSNGGAYNPYSWCTIDYEMQVFAGDEIDEYTDYYIEFAYYGDAMLTSKSTAFYIYPYSYEEIKSCEVTDKSSITVNVTIANAEENGDYFVYNYDYTNDTYEYFAPIAKSGNVYTFCFDKLYYESIDRDYLCINSLHLMKNDTAEDCEEFIGEFFVEYVLESTTDFNDMRWNGIYVSGPISEETKEVYVTIEPSNGENGATAAVGGSYTAEDKEHIKLTLCDGTTGSTVSITTEIELYEDDYGKYAWFDAVMHLSKTLDADHEYYIVVKDKHTSRLAKLEVTTEPSCTFAGISANNNRSYNTNFKIQDSYNCAVIDCINMPDNSKFDVKFLNIKGEEIAKIDKETIDVSDYGSAKTFSFVMNSTDVEIEEYEDYYFNVYYDGEMVYCQNMHCYNNNDVYDDDEYYYNIYVNDNYCVYGQKFVLLVHVNTNDSSFSLEDANLKLLNTSWDEEYAYDFIAEIGERHGNKQYLVEFDISSATQIYNNYYLRYTINDVENSQSFYLNNNMYKDSFFFNNITTLDDSTYTIYGYNLPVGSYKLFMSSYETQEVYKLSGTCSDGYSLKFDISSLPVCEMYKQGWIEYGNKFYSTIDIYDFEYGRNKHTGFYSEYLYQNGRIAIINLPSDLYTSFRLSSTKEGLAAKSFSAIKNQGIYALPDTDGEHKYYAQFKDADGNITDIFETKVNLKRETPDFEITNDLSGTYTTENPYINVYYDTETDGTLNYQLYTNFGSPFSYEYSYYIRADESDYANIYMYFNNANYAKYVNRLDVWFTDIYGNSTDVTSYDIEIKNRYVTYETGGGFIYFDAYEGRIYNMNNLSGDVIIPSVIEGVTVQRIENWSLNNCPNLRSLTLPATITSIQYYSFNGNSSIIYYAPENTYVYDMLNSFGYTVNAIGLPGDINSDRVINGADLVRFAKHFAGWSVTIDEQAADTDADGSITTADLLRLAKYLAGHSVALGE